MLMSQENSRDDEKKKTFLIRLSILSSSVVHLVGSGGGRSFKCVRLLDN